jgi:hypothetical protein
MLTSARDDIFQEATRGARLERRMSHAWPPNRTACESTAPVARFGPGWRSRRDIPFLLLPSSAAPPGFQSCDCGCGRSRTEEMVALALGRSDSDRRHTTVSAAVPGLRGGTCVLCNRNPTWETHTHTHPRRINDDR